MAGWRTTPSKVGPAGDPWPSEVAPDDFRVMTRTFRIRAMSPAIKDGSGANAPERTGPQTVCRISIRISANIDRSAIRNIALAPPPGQSPRSYSSRQSTEILLGCFRVFAYRLIGEADEDRNSDDQ